MDEIMQERTSISTDMARLLAALPAIIQLAPEDPARRAWMIWKDVLIGQVRRLELRERELSSEPYLWITESMIEFVPSGDNRTEG